ncbi:hypothetical protein G6F56_000741 [Rhizopus delemar]|nr:hypothetical protein G6F56_000741 [Rhizopus delemar]
MHTEDNSDNNFQPTILYKKKTSRENTQQSESRKRLKGKQKEKTQESTLGAGVSTMNDSNTLDYTISFDDYDLEFGSENFEDPNSTFDSAGPSTSTFERASAGSIIPSIFIPSAFNSNAASTKPSSHPASAENVNNRAPNNSTAYFEVTGYTPIRLPNAQQIALYECTKIHTAYFNNIKAHFGNRLRALINKLFEKKKKAEIVKKDVQERKCDTKAIKKAIRKKVYEPCNQVRQCITKKINARVCSSWRPSTNAKFMEANEKPGAKQYKRRG